MANRDIELALRIRADLAAAAAKLKEFGKDLQGVGASGAEAGAGAEAAAKGIDALTSASVRATTATAASRKEVISQLEAIIAAEKKQGKTLAEQAAEAQAAGKAQAEAYMKTAAAQERLNAARQANAGSRASQISMATMREQAAAADAAAAASEREATAENTAAAATGRHAAAERTLQEKLASGNVMREQTALMDELISGRTKRIPGTLAVLGGRLGITEKLFTGLGAAIVGTVAIIGTFAAAVYKAEAQEEFFNRVVEKTGGYIGVTRSEYRQMTAEVAASAGSWGKAQDALNQVASTGRFTGRAMENIARGAAAMASITGQKIEKVVGEFTKLSENPAKAAVALNEQYHFLNLATYKRIAALEEEGNKEQAAEVAVNSLASAMEQRASKVQQQESGIILWLQAEKSMWSRLWHGIEHSVSSSTLQDRFDAVTTRINNLSTKLAALKEAAKSTGIENPVELADLERKLKAAGKLQADLANKIVSQKNQAKSKAADEQKTQSDIAHAAAIKNVIDKLKEEDAALGANARQQLIDKLQTDHATAAQIRQALAIFDEMQAKKSALATTKEHEAAIKKDRAAVDQVVQSLSSAKDATAHFRQEQMQLDIALADGAISVKRYRDLTLQLQRAQESSQAGARLHAMQQQVRQLMADESRAEQNVQAQQQAGLITEYTARERILQLHKETAAQIGQMLPELERLTQLYGSPRDVANLKNIEAQFERMHMQVNQLTQALEQGFTSGLERAFQGLATNTMTLGQAWHSLLDSILSSIAQIEARALAAKAIAGLMKLFHQGGTTDVGAGAGKLAGASMTLMGGSVLLGMNADKLQMAADALLVANAMSSTGGTGYASGGHVGGTGSGDIVPAMLTPGEFVVRKPMVQKVGLGFLHALNRGALPKLSHFAAGGVVGMVRSAHVSIQGAPKRSGDLNITVPVTVTNDGNQPMDQSKGKRLAHTIHKAVLAVIVDEKRPGGMLYNGGIGA